MEGPYPKGALLAGGYLMGDAKDKAGDYAIPDSASCIARVAEPRVVALAIRLYP